MNTIKTTALTLLFALFCTVAYSQVGLKAGVNFANMQFEEDESSIEDLARNGSTKFTGGLTFILPLGDAIAIQPEILYTQKGAERSFSVLGEEFTNNLTYHYIDIPLLLRLSLGDTHGEGLGIYINGGGYAGYALSGKSENTTPLGNTETEFTFDKDDQQARIDYGIAAGGGITLGNIFLEVRYNHGINNLLDDDLSNGNDNFRKQQHRGLALSAGIIF